MEKEGSLLYKMLDDMLALANCSVCLIALSSGMYERESTAKHGTARHNAAQHGTARQSMTPHGTARRCVARHRTAGHDTARHRTVLCSGRYLRQHEKKIEPAPAESD